MFSRLHCCQLPGLCSIGAKPPRALDAAYLQQCVLMWLSHTLQVCNKETLQSAAQNWASANVSCFCPIVRKRPCFSKPSPEIPKPCCTPVDMSKSLAGLEHFLPVRSPDTLTRGLPQLRGGGWSSPRITVGLQTTEINSHGGNDSFGELTLWPQILC